MKIIVIGSSGSGKSTFASELAQSINYPILHLDSLWHTTDYSQEAKEWFQQEQRTFMEQAEWIIDGNYRGTMPPRIVQADVIIWLKVAKPVAIFRVLKRSVKFRKNRASRKEMPAQFKEKFDKEYLEFLSLIWGFKEQTLETLIEKYRQPDTVVKIVRSSREKQQLLEQLKNNYL